VDSVNDMEYILKECLKEACNLIAESNKGVASPFCEKIKKYVKEHYNDIDMNVNAIAANFYINPAYLSNMFKRNTDMKLLDYINKVRIEEAKKLLMSKPDISIEELSEKSGFKNSRTFRRIFTKYEDVSPSKFTKSQDVERNDPVKEEF
jgi:YesN/AraC family two-component response regulator